VLPGIGDFPAFTQPKLVLDLVIPGECKAEELTWVVVISQRRSFVSQITGQCYGGESKPVVKNRESDV